MYLLYSASQRTVPVVLSQPVNTDAGMVAVFPFLVAAYVGS